MTFPERLRVARELGELNQRELSDLAGLSPSLVWAIEGGSRPDPTTRTLIALASVLGVSLDWLANGDGPKPSAEDVKRSIRKAKKSSTGTDG